VAHPVSTLASGLQQVIISLKTAVCDSILDIVTCTGIDSFLMSNVNNSFEQHSVPMQELVVA
jgi:hypothetical protein